jgi:hypothetical protein
MTAHADHEAHLRAVLHAAADSLEPRGDGLERIRARLRQPRSMSLAWTQAAAVELVLRAPAWLQDALYHVVDWVRLVAERFAPAQQTGRHRSRAHGLLRPMAAMAVVMFIVAAGTYVAIHASTAIFPSSSNSQPGAPRAGGISGAPGPGASHTSGSQSENGSGRSSAAPSPSCASPKPGQSDTSAPAPSLSPSPSVDPTPADSTTSDTTSPSPADSSTTSDAAASPAPSSQPSANAPTTTSATTPALTKPAGC